MQQEKAQPERLVVGIMEAAAMLDTTHVKVRRMIKSGEIPAEKIAQIGNQKKINLKYIRTLAGETVEG